MPSDPQPAPYLPDPRIESIAGWIGDPVHAAAFPGHRLRWRNHRWAAAVGLDGFDEALWVEHFGRFAPLPGNLPQPLALRYHGHQFRSYNPDLGDGRGFLFAQMRDAGGRLLDLGTKGSGQTPWSRDGDGRLTLKGAVREILATEMLEALGVDTSKTFSVIETGEELWRGDEPSPTRSAVLVRLSHGHIRIGSFQRLFALEEKDHMEALVAYCLETYPGNLPPEDAPGRDEPAVILLHQVVERLADLAAAWMVAGFVHGVLNTDNMNISGESFDYGPWRWLPRWDPRFTAAYFDHSGLYAFGRQPEALLWNCHQLAIALRTLAETAPLVAALDRFGSLYQQAMCRRFTWRLGVESRGVEGDTALIQAAESAMVETGLPPEQFFFLHRGGRNAGDDAFGTALSGYASAASTDDAFWQEPAPPGVLIEEVERIWATIDQHDDWSELHAKVAAIREMGERLGPVHVPVGPFTSR
ncbi:protein adenylyltransferase SelO [Novosphingobium kaempferiae]|uniref:protein adenylyltransferase SelO n=1 Tax=Novosphingobium kaempferiae TaxID=2896849 RepID=UPI001E4F710E|nr:YdiU family protein [Novosphingobium kaempferiae]